jgi:undecaprenyl-diphosphatase
MIRALLRETGTALREHRRWWLACAIIAVAGALVLWPLDAAGSRWFEVTKGAAARAAAKQVSLWGNWYAGWLIVAVLVALVPRRQWRAAALACALAAVAAGVAADLLKSATGRPRPMTGEVDGFTGWRTDFEHQSFPSGHTATAFAAALSLVVALPRVGWPLMFAAVAVGWSRLALGVHYPSDVWAAAWLGAVNGLVFGLAARRVAT